MKRIILFILGVLIIMTKPGFPHCDTMDGPVVLDANLAFDKGNVNYVLKWVRNEDEKEITKAFNQVLKVRSLNNDAKLLAEKYFYDVLVRIHRAGEGVSFTGVKPSGSHIDEKVKAADKSLETGSLSPLENLISKERKPELKELFDKVTALKNYDINDVKAGRKYIEAYVRFFHFAEGGHEEHAHGHEGHLAHIKKILPTALAVIFFILTILFGFLFFKKGKK